MVEANKTLNDQVKQASRDRWLWVLIVPLMLVMVLMAVPRLTSDMYWLDEEMTIAMSGGAHYGPISPVEILVRTSRDRWPPLHNLIIVPWASVFGWSEFSTRVFSLFAGMVGVAVIYRMGATLVSSRVGIVTAFLFAFSGFYVNYLHEARGYTLYVLFAALMMWMYWRVRHQPNPKLWHYVLLWLAIVAQLYTHYVAMAFVAALGGYHLLTFVNEQTWHRLTRTFLLAVLAYSPWVAMAISSMLVERQASRGDDVGTILQDALTQFGNGLGPLILILIAVAFVLHRNRQTFYPALILSLALIAALVMNVFADFLFHSRHIMHLLVPLYLMLGIGIVSMYQHNRYRLGAVAVVVIWGGAGINVTLNTSFIGANNALPTMTSVTQTLTDCHQPDSLVVYYMNPVSQERHDLRVLDYYMHGIEYQYAQIDALSERGYSGTLPDDYEARAVRLTEEAQALWYVQFDGLPRIDASSRANAVFQENYAYCGQAPVNNDVQMVVYSHTAELTCASQTLALQPCSDVVIADLIAE